MLTAAGVASLIVGHGGVGAAEDDAIGNAIFIHPDGTGLNHFLLARHYWARNECCKGPDGTLQWDRLPAMVVYRGHMSDQLTATSNGGATAHAFGVKVQGPDSYGKDRGRAILALSGYPGSFLREAGCYGHPIGVINDGDIAGEPGTGAFLAETDIRGEPNEQTRQFLEGRPGFEKGNDCDPRTSEVENDGDRLPDVILGGGERFFLPEGIGLCKDRDPKPLTNNLPLDCAAHTDPVNGRGPAREDGRNLLQLAHELGYVIMRTRAEFEAVKTQMDTDPNFAPRVLGVFAADDIFNDEEEEQLKAIGLVRDPDDALPPEGLEYGVDKIGNLVLWGAKQDDPERPYSFDPPTIAEMTALGLEALKRRAEEAGKPFAVVIEDESTDNMPNKNNAIGTLRALQRTDDMIGVARNFLTKRDEKTLIITGADSDGSGPQLLALRAVDSSPTGQEDDDIPFNPIQCDDARDLNTCVVTFTNVNPTGLDDGDQLVEVDGVDGRGGKPFLAEHDALLPFRPFPNKATDAPSVAAQPLPFAVVWTSLPDVAGGILSRAEGLNAELLNSMEPFREGEPPFYARFDNTDIYRMVYLTLFGERLPTSVGVSAETR